MAAGIPLLIGITSVIAALMLVGIPSQVFPVDDNLSAVILMIGLAVGVDYSLFYLRREREERAAGRSPEEALQVAAATSGRAVLISGLTVIVAMAGMLISGDKTFIAFAVGTILVVAIAMLASLTVLPAMLSWLGDRVEKGRVPFLGRRRSAAGESRFWPAIIDRVMRRPVLALVLAGGALLALAIPALNLKTVVTGVDDLPQDLAVIKTYNRIKQVFPTEGVTATVVVKADDVRSGDDRSRDRLSAPPASGVHLPARNRHHLQRGWDGCEDRCRDPWHRHRRARLPTLSTRSATTSSRRRSATSRGRASTSAETPRLRWTSGTSSTAGCP